MCCVEIGNNDNIGLFKKLWVVNYDARKYFKR